MKKVIFVCLLSLSVCLSQPSTPLEATAQNPAVTAPKSNATELDAGKTKADHSQAAAAETPVPTVTAQNATANATKTSNETSTITNETVQDKKNASTDIIKTSTTTAPETPVDPPAKGNNKTEPAPAVVPAAGTNSDSKDSKKNETTTIKPGENVVPTAAPIEAKSRAFDGPSFIGGIILTLGLLAIGFMGFKYYKNQTERNYHTL